MPAKMLDTFMDAVMLDNGLTKAGALKIARTPIDIDAIGTPLCFVSLKDDHVANWETTYRGARRFKADKRFYSADRATTPARSIRPPPASTATGPTTPSRRRRRTGSPGPSGTRDSWWPEWLAWLKAQSGPEAPARPVEGGPLPILEAAPGSYARGYFGRGPGGARQTGESKT